MCDPSCTRPAVRSSARVACTSLRHICPCHTSPPGHLLCLAVSVLILCAHSARRSSRVCVPACQAVGHSGARHEPAPLTHAPHANLVQLWIRAPFQTASHNVLRRLRRQMWRPTRLRPWGSLLRRRRPIRPHWLPRAPSAAPGLRRWVFPRAACLEPLGLLAWSHSDVPAVPCPLEQQLAWSMHLLAWTRLCTHAQPRTQTHTHKYARVHMRTQTHTHTCTHFCTQVLPAGLQTTKAMRGAGTSGTGSSSSGRLAGGGGGEEGGSSSRGEGSEGEVRVGLSWCQPLLSAREPMAFGE